MVTLSQKTGYWTLGQYVPNPARRDSKEIEILRTLMGQQGFPVRRATRFEKTPKRMHRDDERRAEEALNGRSRTAPWRSKAEGDAKRC